ncbi:MAG: hypothetical protein KDI64_03675, partial [Candidatus Accumulibacter sp.]|nr:hypothetical protein [Accumulibacter sp.]
VALADLEQLLQERCPAGWSALPAVQSSLAAVWADLGDFARAHAAYLAAVQAEDGSGRVPIRDIEQLANLEARMGEEAGDGALIDSALQRLGSLDSLVAESSGKDAVAAVNAERCA